MIKSKCFPEHEGVAADRPEGIPYPRVNIARVTLYVKFKTQVMGDAVPRGKQILPFHDQDNFHPLSG